MTSKHNNRFLQFLMVFIFGALGRFAMAQDHQPQDNNVLHYFSSGILTGQIRDYTMATINHQGLHDYYANAIGASIHYETAPYKGFSAGLNGIFVYGTFGNDLLEVDSTTGEFSRYELQLFDVEHKGNYTDLDRLEELYIKYENKGLRAMYGKVEIETPLVNKHDGRMKPKVFSGLMADYERGNTTFSTAWFNKASPRSTTHWYKIEDAIGLYESGFHSDSINADYHENISSRGLGIFGVQTDSMGPLTLNLWNYYLENISHSALIKLDIEIESGLYGGTMFLYQEPIGNGGSDIEHHKYHIHDESTKVLSGRIGRHFPFCDINLNATHVFNSGMFLFPREFGVDPTYTFIPRSQIEGQQAASSYGITVLKEVHNLEVKLDWNHMSTSENTEMNKYKLPSYDQFNVDCSYDFAKGLSGLHLRLLYVYRRAQEADLTQEEMFNQANFHQINLVANFDFSSKLIPSLHSHHN